MKLKGHSQPGRVAMGMCSMWFKITQAASIALIAAGIFAPASAQQRSPNIGKQAFLHQWPESGVWDVALVRLVPDGKLGCVVMTGYHNFSTGERYLWGIRKRGTHIALEILDSNPFAVSGSKINVIVDGAPIGAYPITGRFNNVFHTIVSDLSDRDGVAIGKLMSLGGNMKFVTRTATYSAPLAGVPRAMQEFHACSLEANQINSAQAQ